MSTQAQNRLDNDRPQNSRPGALSLNIREKSILYAAYMPFLKGGGIFIPTTKQYRLGDEIFLLIGLMGDTNKIRWSGLLRRDPKATKHRALACSSAKTKAVSRHATGSRSCWAVN